MPPSPYLRYSPGKGLHGDSHKRGRSLESGLSIKEKDDDLTLFNEMQNKDDDNFLLQSTGDSEDILSTKMKSFPDFKLGIAIPPRGEISDLLNIDGDKSDYDWLLTPPDTPLFPSLDDEPPPANLIYSGRPRSRPISISRSSTMEKNCRTSRGSASPQRSSQSPGSSANNNFQSRGRPSSAPRSSPSPTLRYNTPTRRPSPPPIKPFSPPRSSTPTPRRSSVGSVAGLRGQSPVRSSRGASSSPKVKAWKSNIPGFSLEAPPNLRTSLADRPASYVRGSSPASRNSRDSSSMFRRQSMSPTATRSISSSHSHERVQSSHSKGSIASSGDDDAESLLSSLVNESENSLSQKGVGGFPSNRTISFSKKHTKTSFPSSAPKRSFDSAIRQMDKRSPQNMFRPLLSSVPSTTFYGGKTGSSHRTMISRNSSLTTSSNASSDQVTSGAPCTEGSEHNQEDIESEFGRIPYADGHDEIFTFDKIDSGQDTGLDLHDCVSDACPNDHHKVSSFESIPDDTDGFHHYLPHHTNALVGANSEVPQEDAVDGDIVLCSRCGCSYNATELMEDDENLCPACNQKEVGVVANSKSSSRDDVLHSLAEVSEEVALLNSSKPIAATVTLKGIVTGIPATESSILTVKDNERETQTTFQESNECSFLDKSYSQTESDNSKPVICDVEFSQQPVATTDGIPKLHNSHDGSLTSVEVTEGAGISVLLSNRPSSSKGPVIQGRGFTATAVSYGVRSYTRDSTTSMKSSNEYGSVSTSSSADESSRNSEMHIHPYLSAKKNDINPKPESVGSSFSRTSSYISQGLGLAVSAHDENFDSCDGNGGNIVTEGPHTSLGPALAVEKAELLDREASFSSMALLEEDDHENSRANDYPGFKLSNDASQLDDSSSLQLFADEERDLHVDNLPMKLEVISVTSDSSLKPAHAIVEEGGIHFDGVNQMEVSEAFHGDTAPVLGIEFGDHHPESPGSKNCGVGGDSPGTSLEAKDTGVSASVSNYPEVEAVHGILCEPTVMMEDQEGGHTRSLTLEEATDAILFCSSIIHDLAFKAASIAIDKEKENVAPIERLIPTIKGGTDNTSSSAQDLHGRPTSKRNIRVHKSKRRHEETETTLHCSDAVEEQPVPVHNVGLPHKVDSVKPPPPKLESKCNCTIM